MKAFVVYPTYRIVDEKAYVYLFGRLSNGESFLSISEFEPYFFIKTSDLDKAKALASTHEELYEFKAEESDYKNFKDEPLTKVTVHLPAHVPIFRKRFENDGIACFEADIRFSYRFMIDFDIKGSFEIDGEFKKGTFVDRIYENPKLTPAKWVPELKILSFDIETSGTAQDLYAISIVTGDLEKVLIVSQDKVYGADVFPDEKSLLEKFKEIVLEQDPDIITGWNVVDFDFKVLKSKFDHHKIDFNIGRADWPTKLRITDSYFRDSVADVPGRAVLDGIRLLKMSFIGLRDYKLATAAETFTEEKKLITSADRRDEIERLYREDKPQLARYNLKDSQLVLKILKNTGVLNLTIERSLLTGMQLDRVDASIASLDNLYLRGLKDMKYVAPSGGFGEREERIKGGFVRNPQPGIYDYVVVLDFKSLYPSIMRTFNIDPLSYIPEKKTSEKDIVVAPNGAKFRNQDGLLSRILQELWVNRDKAKKRKDKLASQAIKILMNSIFGVLANPHCRFYSLEMGNAITSFGQHLIKLTADLVEKMGYTVIYGDTDSIFVDLGVNSRKDAEKIGKEIQDEVNKYYEKHTKEDYNRKNFLELEFEKTYKKLMLPHVRGSEAGAKKRYVGLKDVNGKDEIEIVGLEFVRRDWTELAKNFQYALINKVFNNEDVTIFVKNYIEDLNAGKLDDKLIYRKALRKGIKEYTKTTPPHVKAARLLNKIESNIIEYVMTIDGPQPLEKVTSSLDYQHYIDKQIKPLADSILSLYNKNFDDILRNSNQTSLGDF